MPRTSYVETCLAGREGPVIAATDYMRLFADQIRTLQRHAEALDDAGLLESGVDRRRVGVLLGAGLLGLVGVRRRNPGA